MKKFSAAAISITTIVFSFLITTQFAFAAPVTRVSISPSTVTLPENGGTQVYEVRLDEPIIAPSFDDGYVTLTIALSDFRATVQTGTITFLESEWSHAKHFTVTTVGDAIHNTNNLVTVTLTAASNSEYYNHYTNSLTKITLVDDDSESGTVGGTVMLFGCKDPKATNYDPNPFVLADNNNCHFTTTPTSKSFFSFTKNLKQGMDDPDVLELQKFLNTHGAPVAPAGLASLGNEVTTFGTKTRIALMQYQRANGITPATGYFGPVTRAFINNLLTNN